MVIRLSEPVRDTTARREKWTGQGRWRCRPEALLPNRVGESASHTATNYLQGGLNESYDAADYQNMFLAARALDRVQPEPLAGAAQLPSDRADQLLGQSGDLVESGLAPPRDSATDALGSSEFRRRERVLRCGRLAVA